MMIVNTSAVEKFRDHITIVRVVLSLNLEPYSEGRLALVDAGGLQALMSASGSKGEILAPST